MLLNAANQTITVRMDDAHNTTAPTVVTDYVDVTTTTFLPATAHGTLNGTTPVVAVSAPGASTQRKVKNLTVFNEDDQAHWITVEQDFNGTPRKLCRREVQPGTMLFFSDEKGWSNGFLEQGPAGPAGATYTHTQSVASDTWTVNHNLGFRPDITVYSDGGVELDAVITHINNNQATVSFDSAITGTARAE